MKKILFLLVLCLSLALFVSCGNNEAVETTDAPELPPEPMATAGLEYSSDGNGGYAVTGYAGSDTEIYVPDVYDGLAVTAIGDCAFMGNAHITEVAVGKNVKSVGVAAFANCKSLTSVSLGEGVEKIGMAAFFGCNSLKTASLPSGIKSIGIDAFLSCDAVDEISYNGNQSMWSRIELGHGNDVFNTELVLAEGGALIKLIAEGDCNSNISWRLGYDGILYITGSGHVPDYEFDKTPWGAYSEEILAIVVEEGIDIVGKNCFIGCYNAESVTLAPSVRLIDNGAFYNCSSLTAITLPDRLRRIGENAFYGCSSLKEIVIPDSVTAMGSGAFMGCSSLDGVKLSSQITRIEKWSFAECQALKSVDLSAVEYVGTNAFFRCSQLAVVTLGEKLAEVENNAFLDCPKASVLGTRNPAAVIGTGNESIN